jgi:hypothetical protein
MLVASKDTAVVILSYNGKSWHEKFLPLILSEAASGYEVFVADNASTDDTLPYVRDNFPEARTLHIPINKGFAGGYAEALKQISAKYYVLLSSDFEVSEGWFPPLLEAFKNYQGLAICQPKIRYWREREKFEYAGAAGGFMDSLGYLFCRGRIFNDIEADEGQYNDDIEVFWASGGCFMVRADLYHKVGGLDPDLFAHMEEVDLCWRLKSAGYRIGAIGDSTVYHVGGSVISYGSPQKLFYNFRNSLIILCKNEPASRLLWLLPARMILDGVAGLQALMQGKWRDVGAILRAHGAFYRVLPQTLKKRRETVLIRKHPNNTGRYPGSIVWQYFALRKKRFPQLKWEPKRL